jgi:hypothetical protein
MIKFKCAIHKETGIIINYNEWKEKVEDKRTLECIVIESTYDKLYKPIDILINDDFEIIYDLNLH